MRTRRFLLGLVGVLLVIAVAIGWTAIRPAVRPDLLPAPIRISEPARIGTAPGPAPAAPTTDAPPVPPDVVPPPPLPAQGEDDDVDDGEDGDDADDADD